MQRTKQPSPKMIRRKKPNYKYWPGVWIPTGKYGHVILHVDGVKGMVHYAPCPRKGLGKLLDHFVKIGRLPMTMQEIRQVIWEGKLPTILHRL